MKTATIEILEEGEEIFGSRTNGEYFVRRYEDGEEMGGGFFKTPFLFSREQYVYIFRCQTAGRRPAKFSTVN